MGSGPGRPAPWMRVAVAMLAVGWGANQFSSLLLVYRSTSHLPDTFVSLAFATYALGLIPALLVGAALADRVDRRLPLRLAVVLAGVGTLLLAAGSESSWLLLAGRFVSGVASGAALAPGSAWIAELSHHDGPGAGARRSTIALSIGFGFGPLVTGVIAQWAPLPELTPYSVHVVLTVIALLAVWNVPDEPGVTRTRASSRRAEIRATLLSPAFLRTTPATAPWVFGTASTAFAIAPSILTVPGYGVVVSGTAAGLTLGAGVAIQPLAKHMERQRPGLARRTGLVLTAVGLLIAAAAFEVHVVWLIAPIAIALGGAYGLLLVSGLRRVEDLAHPDDRAAVNAFFYALTYVGFAAPLVFSELTAHQLGPSALMIGGAVIAAATSALRQRPAEPEPRA
ncbi:MFS transporter [Pseudonocardia alaniniphila]|uniref:MFS transporter n=1 Tax=Pseudonocardia alaniniphila TaxID=75291 RepID=A0ABS9TCS4_9PSEU|nr:MFS transporter [Pseudonocardia alaniniphila]MCH6166344.1 MFS transporter [Pseudonocardia alaniniphila]